MSYQLKTTGIAANLLTCIAVDPDTDSVKDFCSASITSTLTLQSGVTVSSATWNGTSRKFIQTTATNCIAFGANKPLFEFNSTTATARTVVFIGQVAGGDGRIFGDTTANARFGENYPGIGGATYPFFQTNTAVNGNLSVPAAGSKRIYGHSLAYGGEAKWYTAADTDSSMTSGVASAAFSPSVLSKSLGYVGRHDYSSTMAAIKIHAVLIFNSALSEAQWDSLRTDWFGTLFESTGGSASTQISATTDDAVFSGASVGYVASCSTQITATTADAMFSGSAFVAAGSGSFVTDPMVNNAGEIQDSVAVVYEWRVGTGIGVAPTSVNYGTGTTDASGVLTATGLASGTGALLVATTDRTSVYYQAGTVV